MTEQEHQKEFGRLKSEVFHKFMMRYDIFYALSYRVNAIKNWFTSFVI